MTKPAFYLKHPCLILQSLGVLLLLSLPAFGADNDKGISAAELLRQVGIVVIIVALIGLIAVEFFYKKKLDRSAYKWLLFLGLLLLPLMSMLSATTTLMEETKTVASCSSCHLMHPFVNDMHNPHSASLASRHFRNKWIAEDQCYHCHTSYGIHGTFEGKRDGFRHWLLFVTKTWKEPISFKGSYPNSNCLSCHGESPKFREVVSHAAIKESLMTNQTSCSTCHGPVHPTPLERNTKVTALQIDSLKAKEVTRFMQSFETASVK
jgi:nitrate/TMAO reductase-like tetraheme cytochrome c subunit